MKWSGCWFNRWCRASWSSDPKQEHPPCIPVAWRKTAGTPCWQESLNQTGQSCAASIPQLWKIPFLSGKTQTIAWQDLSMTYVQLHRCLVVGDLLSSDFQVQRARLQRHPWTLILDLKMWAMWVREPNTLGPTCLWTSTINQNTISNKICTYNYTMNNNTSWDWKSLNSRKRE